MYLIEQFITKYSFGLNYAGLFLFMIEIVMKIRINKYRRYSCKWSLTFKILTFKDSKILRSGLKTK